MDHEETLILAFVDELDVVEFLGGGSFGKVWRAHDRNLDRDVALKAMSRTSEFCDWEAAIQALRSEARILAQIRHPNVVDVYALREDRGLCFLWLEYVDGGSFERRLQSGERLSWRDVVRYGADMARGLAAVHAHGVIHRDIKPANVLWRRAGGRDQAVLADFGVAALREASGAGSWGTLHYMAPEAFQGVVNESIDVYGLTATLFRLLTGEVPFPHATTSELMNGQRLSKSDPRLEQLPEVMTKLLRAGLRRDPAKRPGVQRIAKYLERVAKALSGSN